MEKIHPRAAGIDLGSREVYVSVPDQPVRHYATFTEDLAQLAAFLVEHRISTVAMEATGVYWIVLYDLLEAAGLEVCLVNGAHVRNVPGRKSDVSDCQWLQQLHSCGLLHASFVPPQEVRVLRSYRRLREDHIERAADSVRHMQKALDLMNIKLHTVVSQLSGASGMRIIDAILAGQRNAGVLTELCDAQILKTKRAAVERSLRGNWKPEQLFALGQARCAWQFYQDQIAACDREIDTQLQKMGGDKPEPPPRTGPVKAIRHNAPRIEDLDTKLRRLTGGVDPTLIPGFTDRTFLQLVAETGLDLSRWATSGHFTSWLGLAPSMHQSGRSRKRRRGKKKTQAGQIFRLMAQSIGQSKLPALGGFYRRIRARQGAPVAIVATARKLAVLYYQLMRYGKTYVEEGLAAYEKNYRRDQLQRLRKQAIRLGFSLMPQPASEGGS
jgi:transposase